jgi:hypothetical protein
MNGLKKAIQDIGCSMQDIATDKNKYTRKGNLTNLRRIVSLESSQRK